MSRIVLASMVSFFVTIVFGLFFPTGSSNLLIWFVVFVLIAYAISTLLDALFPENR